MKFVWATVMVSDLDRSLKFYQDLIGLPLNRRMKPGPELEIAFLGSGETEVELICPRDAGQIQTGGNITLGFKTDSLNDFMDVLKRQGLKIHSGPFQPAPFIRYLYLHDPDGTKIQIVEQLS
jgi:lactoylglutathione lyase